MLLILAIVVLMVGLFCLFCPSTRSPYPSDWIEDQSLLTLMKTVARPFSELVPPAQRMAATPAGTYASNPSTMKFWHGSGAEAQRVAFCWLDAASIYSRTGN